MNMTGHQTKGINIEHMDIKLNKFVTTKNIGSCNYYLWSTFTWL